MLRLEFTVEGWSDYLHWQEQDIRQLKRINKLIQESLKTPQYGTGKPEPLKWELKGCWSRRIDQEHRLVYRVQDDILQILACRTHYQ